MKLYVLSSLNELGSEKQWQALVIAIVLLLATILFILFDPWDRAKQKERKKEEKVAITKRSTQLLRKPSEDERKLVAAAIPQLKDDHSLMVFVYSLFVVMTAGLAFGAWRSSGHWSGLIGFGLPALFGCGLFISIKENHHFKQANKQIQQENYLVAKGIIIYCQPGKNSCHMSGFIGEPPSEYNSYDNFIESSLKIFTEFSMPHAISSFTFVRHFLFVSVGNCSFVIVQLPNGKILTTQGNNVFLCTHTPMYVYDAYKDALISNNEHII